MIIDFAQIRDSYYTAEEGERLEEIRASIKKLELEYRRKYGKEFKEFYELYNSPKFIDIPETGWKRDFFDQRSELMEEAFIIRQRAKKRYIEAKGISGILSDIKRIVENFTKEDFLEHLRIVRERFSSITVQFIYEGMTEEETREVLEEQSRENSTNLYFLLVALCNEPYNAIDRENREARERALQIIKDRVKALGYTEDPLKEEPELPTLQKYDFVYPSELQQNLTKASKKIFDSSIALSDLKQAEIDITPNKKGVVNTFSVYVDMTAPELKGTENVTEYDKSVHNMAVSIGLANKHGFFTARELATALIHGDNPNNNRVSSQQIGAVTKSIEKQRHIDITIDWTEHIKLNHKGNLPEDASNFTVKDYMLPVREYTATIGGKTLHGYQFIDPVKLSPLYQYARSVGQLGQHPVKMLNIPINLDQQKLVIRDFLLEEIAHIKNPKTSWGNTISVEKLLEVAGEDSQTIRKEKKKKLLDAVEEMLAYWKKQGYIKKYEQNRASSKGKPIKSFTIEV